MNIVFIFSDQHNPKFTGYEGHPFVETPNLDALVARGVRFGAAYTANPICVPARHAMLSGMYTRNNCVYRNQSVPPLSLPSFARYLSENGWRTCLVGKGHFHGRAEDLEDSRDYVYRGYDERLFGDLLGTGHQSYPSFLAISTRVARWEMGGFLALNSLATIKTLNTIDKLPKF